jgi:hypothetical protein
MIENIILFLILNVTLLIFFLFTSGNFVISIILLNLLFINLIRIFIVRQRDIFIYHYDVNYEPDILQKLQYVKLNESIDCPICLETLDEGFKFNCNCKDYIFHADCVKECIKRSTLCPLCRTDLV